MKKLTKLVVATVFFVSLSLASIQSKAHCEIPCGIYGDSIRFALLYEHIATVEKSMNMIRELSAQASPDYNQLVRWVVNKEEHAAKIQEIVSQYFLHQRIKPVTGEDKAARDKYLSKLESLHNILVLAMKSKQSTDAGIIDSLNETVHNFEHLYYDKADH